MKVKKVLITSLLLILAILLTAGGMILHDIITRYARVNLSPRKQTETRDLLNPPECGWYQLYAYRLEPGSPIDDWHLYIREKDDEGNPYRLALLEFNLSSYRDRELDDAAKENIRNVLANFQKTEAKVILRFLYDWDGKGMETEPETISIIKRHMEQASQAFNPFHKIIHTTQGIFVGSWGEMHTSKHLAVEDMTDLLLHYASVTEESIYLAVRTPSHYRSIMEEMEQNASRYEKYGISRELLATRLGLFNDGMLGSISDVGTYHEADIAATRKEGKEIRKKEIAFQNALCLQVPNGGESVNDNPYNDGKKAVDDLRAMRVSYLNQIYDEKVIKKWKDSTYAGKDSLYRGMSTYDYISRHLGPRFVLQDTTLHHKPYQKGNARGSVTIKNVGFSNLYHEKKADLCLVSKKTGKKASLFSTTEKSSEYQPCRWMPGETVTLPFEINPFQYEPGEYILLFSLSDPESGECLLLANDSFDQGRGGYLLGDITIEHH